MKFEDDQVNLTEKFPFQKNQVLSLKLVLIHSRQVNSTKVNQFQIFLEKKTTKRDVDTKEKHFHRYSARKDQLSDSQWWK